MGGRGDGGGVYVRVWVGGEPEALQDLVNRSVCVCVSESVSV